MPAISTTKLYKSDLVSVYSTKNSRERDPILVIFEYLAVEHTYIYLKEYEEIKCSQNQS